MSAYQPWEFSLRVLVTTGLTEILDSEIVYDSEAPRTIWKRVVSLFV